MANSSEDIFLPLEDQEPPKTAEADVTELNNQTPSQDPSLSLEARRQELGRAVSLAEEVVRELKTKKAPQVRKHFE
jgi:hypothetical protein